MKPCPHCRGTGLVADNYAFRAPGRAVLALQAIVAEMPIGGTLVSKALTARICTAEPSVTRRQVWNAVTYMVRAGHLRRAGYGRYEKVRA